VSADKRIPVILYRDDDACTKAGTLMPTTTGWAVVRAGIEPIRERVIGEFLAFGEALEHARAHNMFRACELRTS